jgi:hypothetical protein
MDFSGWETPYLNPGGLYPQPPCEPTVSGASPSMLIDRLVADLGDWRGDRIAQIRRLMHEADAEMVEEWKWMGTPTWSDHGIVAIANPHKGKVKVTFAHGAHLPDPQKLFNAGLGGNEWRAVDTFEADAIDESALKDLIRAAVSYNRSTLTGKSPSKPRPNAPRTSSSHRAHRKSK